MTDATPAPATTPTHPRMWKTDAPLPGKSRRKVLLGVILAIVALAGVGIGLLYWLSPPRQPAVLPVTITANPDGTTTAWLEQDRAALAEGNLLGAPLDDWSANPHRDQIRLRFRALTKTPRHKPVVAYLAAPAAVDASGAVFLLPADKVGDHPRNRLTLNELLTAFRDCPARNRLLILNLVSAPENPLFAPPAGDLSAAVFKALEDVPDAGRLCLVSCSPGQAPVASPELGHSAFGYYLELGLRGAADGWSGETPDSRVTAVELAAFVRSKVGEWSNATQSPVLLGSAEDFTLRAVTGPINDDPTATAMTFPDWLQAGWARGEKLRPVAWAFRKSRLALLAAERDLLSGRPAGAVQSELEAKMSSAEQLAAALAAVPTPDPLPTLAAVATREPPDAALLAELRTAVRALDVRPATPTMTTPAPAPPPSIPPEFEPFKAKPHSALATAAFAVLAEDPAPTAARVKALSALLAAQSPVPKFAETVLIRRLADLAATPGVAWSSERAALALQAARALEDAAARPEVHAWASPALDRAYQLRADAEAAFFSPGYASPEEATRRLRASEATCRRMKEEADQLRAARSAWDDATEWLAGATPLVDSGAIAFPVAEQLADATRKLGDALTPPATSLDLDAFATRAAELERLATAVRSALADFARPLRPDSLAKLRARAEVVDAGPAVVAELDAILATPLVPVADRGPLWNARAVLSQRLAEAALRKDASQRDAIRRRLAQPPTVEPREVVAEAAADPEVVQRRVAWTLALLSVGGVNDKTIETELTKLAADRFAFAERLRRVWTEDAPASTTARLSRVMPVLPTAFDSPAKNPEAIIARDNARKLWAWQATRFEYEARDNADSAFPILAARACRAAAGAGSSDYLEVSALPAPKLTPERREAELRVNLQAIGDRSPETVRLNVLSPGDAWAKATAPEAVTLDPLRQAQAAFRVAAGDNPVSFPEARGVLVEAQAGGRTYHRRVSVSLDEITNQLHLLVRTTAGQPPTPVRDIRLRPDGTPQPYQFLLANPTPRDRKVIARLAGLGREVEVTVPARKAAALVFPAPPPAAAPVPPPPGQTPPPDLGILVPRGELKLELINPADREEVEQTIRVPVVVANPADYLRVTDPVFLPAAGAKPNRLSVTVVPGDVPPGGPVTVGVAFPDRRKGEERRLPGLVVRDGNLVGPVSRGGSQLTLYAENLALPGPGGTDVWVTIAADGVERVLTYTATLPSLGETVRLTPVGKPMVRVNVEPVATGTAPLPVTLEVDNAPPGATLELLVGTAAGKDLPVAADLTLPVSTAKDIAARLKFDPKGETFLFTGSIKDHSPVVQVEFLVGRRVLEARLLDRDRKEIATDRVDVIFDGSPPRNVRFLDLPPKARKDQPLAVRATCAPTVSGIKEVKFFLGKPQNNAPPQNPPPVAGKLFDEKTNEWRASLPVEGQKGVVTVGVQIVTNAGLAKIETQDVELVDPADLNKPEPGSITGKVIELRLTQKGREVFLYDEKGNVKDKKVSKDDGTFAFPDLPPGRYYLYTQNTYSNSDAKLEVEVKPGMPTPVTLELLLK